MILILLLFVNAFLFVLVMARRQEAAVYDRTALIQTVQALEGSGIQADTETLSPADNLSLITFTRDPDREEAMAAALLGTAVTQDNLGGGLTQYSSEAGTVSFRYGVDVSFRQVWEKSPLFSCTITFRYRGGSLESLSGTLLISDLITEEPAQTLSLPTGLMRFLDGILASGDVCSSIRSMTPGYFTIQSYTSDVRMTPMWLISTNAGDYFLDAVSGALTRVGTDTPAAYSLPGD